MFDTAFGPMVQILVGATIVGSMETVWCGMVTPPREGIVRRWTYPAHDSVCAVNLKKGEEMGRFKLGSTVINLFPADTVALNSALANGVSTRMGNCWLPVSQRMMTLTQKTALTARRNLTPLPLTEDSSLCA